VHARPGGNEGDRTIANDGAHFFLTGRDGILSKVAIATGADVWTRDLAQGDTTVLGWHPSVGTTQVYACTSREQPPTTYGKLWVFDKISGALNWSIEYEPDPLRVPTSRCNGDALELGDRVYVSTGDGNLYAHDALTGAILWRKPGIIPGQSGDLRFIVTNGQRLFVTSTVGGIQALDPTTGSLVWSDTIPVSPVRAPVAADDVLVLSGIPLAYVYNAMTGARVWVRPVLEPPFDSPPYQVKAVGYGKGVVYFQGTAGLRAKSVR
jgi:outer membrane protein assembly factor BamB